ncbi:MAG TPA: LysR family transcriptional regulator [Caulobacteraceae bacterium]
MAGLTFRQLEVFVSAVEAGSFRACAERLSISQMAVSEHVRALERQIGYALLDRRRGATSKPTEAGLLAYRHAKQILAEIDDLLSVARPAAPGPARLRIAAHGYIAESLSGRLAQFGATHPDVGLELERRSFESVVSGLADNEIDIGFFLSRGPVAELGSVVAWREDLALYVGRGHPLAGRASVAPADLQGFPFVQLPAKSHLRLQVDSALEALGVRHWRAGLTSDDLATIVEHLSGSASFACLFARGADQLALEGKLARLPLAVAIPPLEVRHAAAAFRRRSPLVAELVAGLPPGGP